MPSEQEMQDLQAELATLAATIEEDSGFLFTESLSLEQLKDDLEEIRAETMRGILNNKQLFPNAEWREIGARDAESDNIATINLKTDINTQSGIVSGLKASIEKTRKIYRSKELLMLYYANTLTK